MRGIPSINPHAYLSAENSQLTRSLQRKHMTSGNSTFKSWSNVPFKLIQSRLKVELVRREGFSPNGEVLEVDNVRRPLVVSLWCALPFRKRVVCHWKKYPIPEKTAAAEHVGQKKTLSAAPSLPPSQHIHSYNNCHHVWYCWILIVTMCDVFCFCSRRPYRPWGIWHFLLCRSRHLKLYPHLMLRSCRLARQLEVLPVS
jgi:hypothetical protein